MDIPVLIRSLKSSILSSTSFQTGKTFWWVVSAAVEQSRRKANTVARGDVKFGPRGWPQNPSKPKMGSSYSSKPTLAFLLLTARPNISQFLSEDFTISWHQVRSTIDWFLFSSETLISGSWGSTVVKCLVGLRSFKIGCKYSVGEHLHEICSFPDR